MHWNPDQITNLATQLAAIVSGLVLIIRLMKHNEDMSNKAASSTPSDIANKILDNAKPPIVTTAWSSVGAPVATQPATVVQPSTALAGPTDPDGGPN